MTGFEHFPTEGLFGDVDHTAIADAARQIGPAVDAGARTVEAAVVTDFVAHPLEVAIAALIVHLDRAAIAIATATEHLQWGRAMILDDAIVYLARRNTETEGGR